MLSDKELQAALDDYEAHEQANCHALDCIKAYLAGGRMSLADIGTNELEMMVWHPILRGQLSRADFRNVVKYRRLGWSPVGDC